MKIDEQVAAPVPMTGTQVPRAARVIPLTEWPEFCRLITENFHSIATSVERREMGDKEEFVAEAHDLPLEQLTPQVLENGVAAITVVLRGEPRKKRFDVTGPRALRFYQNSAGWPVRLEIEYEAGVLILQFTGDMEPGRAISSNTWGE
jgi:hypothetical protein